jgi:hypothetical protein
MITKSVKYEYGYGVTGAGTGRVYSTEVRQSAYCSALTGPGLPRLEYNLQVIVARTVFPC